MEERWSPQVEMAVLCRTRAQLVPIADALEELGVPYEIVGLGGMLSVPEVADVRAALTVAPTPSAVIDSCDCSPGRVSAPPTCAPWRHWPEHRSVRLGSRPAMAGVRRSGSSRTPPLLSEAIETLARWEETGRSPGPRIR